MAHAAHGHLDIQMEISEPRRRAGHRRLKRTAARCPTAACLGPAIDRKRHAMAARVLYGRLKQALQAVGSLRTVRPLVG